MPDVAQTPGTWLLSPDTGGFSDECIAALMACGIDPGGFGSYDDVKKNIDQAAGGLDKNYMNSADFAKNDPGRCLKANSQSGHMAQNAAFQHSGGRSDPCTNVPPKDNGSRDSERLRLYDGRAPSTYHPGKSSTRGTVHGNVTLGVEKQYPEKKNDPLTHEQIKQKVRETAVQQANNNRQKHLTPQDGKKKTNNPDQVNNLANAQAEAAKRMQEKNPKAAELAAQSPATPGQPNGASGPAPNKSAVDMAADCIAAEWESKMAQFRAKAVNESEVGQSKASQEMCAKKGKKNFSDLDAKDQQKVIEQNTKPQGNIFAAKPPGPPSQPEATKNKVPTPPNHGKAKNPPSKEDCLKAQQNHLAYQTANNNGKPPGWAGRVPGGTKKVGGQSTTGENGTC